MAGGFDKRGMSGVPLHARVRATSAPEPANRQQTPTTLRAADPCPVRHCWVNAPADGGAPRPGLLVEWRKDAAGCWEGRVVYAAELRPGHWATVEEWLAAGMLSTG